MATATIPTFYVCQSCGFQAKKWLGRCPECLEWNSLVEEYKPTQKRGVSRGSIVPALHYPDVEQETFFRLSTDDVEVDRVLGGGIVPGSIILLGGEPGIGKSTLVLQIAESLSRQNRSVLYVAGEESAQQIKLRGQRLGVQGCGLYLLSETNLESLLERARDSVPGLLVVDSIQTVSTSNLESAPGSIGQIRECAGQLLTFAKETQIPVILIGHINKEGHIAGPKTLEHVVDAVVYFEGDRYQNQRMIRAVKNRFGPANELGFFEMTGSGLQPIESPSEFFLNQRAEGLPGSTVVCTMEGSRPMLIEIQALVSRAEYGTARRAVNGVDASRVAMLLATLEKRVGIELLGRDVYLNVVGGFSLAEPAADLGIVAAILSSYQNRSALDRSVFLGEVGLTGEIRRVNLAEARAKEAASLGFQTVVLPKDNLPFSEPSSEIDMVGVDTIPRLLEVLDSR